jgi:hypothetical protein
MSFHVSATGDKTIESMLIEPVDQKDLHRDNYDFVAGDGLAQEINEKVLIPLFDPYNLSLNRKPVYINFSGSAQPITNYDESKFKTDTKKSGNITFELGGFSEYVKENKLFLEELIGSIFSDPLLSYQRQSDGFRVIYGKPEDDDLNVFDYKNNILGAIAGLADVLPDLAELIVQKVIDKLEDKKKIYD